MTDVPSITLQDRRAAILETMDAHGLRRLVVASTGVHMIDLPNPLMHLTGFRSAGPAFVTLEGDGTVSALVSPSEDAERAGNFFNGAARAVNDLPTSFEEYVQKYRAPTAVVGFDALPHRLAERALATLGESTKSFDKIFYQASSIKTGEEIARARRATEIAEQGYVRLKELARPGMRECALAVELNMFMKELGADDSFLLLNAGPRADAVMPSSERLLAPGDLILVELSPSVEGQFVQICRTVALGEPPPDTLRNYSLLIEAMRAGIAQVRPGQRMGTVCSAIDDFLSDAGFAQYSRPPFIRRRGHGLGAGSPFPGDVAVDNDTLLEAGMIFIVHPNQFLPATGYMMCGEPVLVGADGPVVMSRREAQLDVVAV